MNIDDKPNNIRIPTPDPEPIPAVLIFFDPKTGCFGHKFAPGAPISGIVNHLEVVKMQLLLQQVQNMQMQGGLVMPDGSPARW